MEKRSRRVASSRPSRPKKSVAGTVKAALQEVLREAHDSLPEEASFGERVKVFRTTNLMSQVQLAESTGLSRSAIAQWESDLAIPSATNLKAASRSLKVPQNWLLPKNGKS
jgi:DNA-binding transcriptional regulator YiaG